MVGARPAAAADVGPLPACGKYASNFSGVDPYPSVGCVTAVDLSTQTIDGRVGGPVTVTATTTGPAKPCLRAFAGETEVRLNPTGTAGRYSGTWTIPAGTVPGSYGITEIWAVDACGGDGTQWWQKLERNESLGSEVTTPAIVQVTGDPGDAAPEFRAVEVSGTSFDTTAAAGEVIVRTHVVGRRGGITRVFAEAMPIGLTGGLDRTTLAWPSRAQTNRLVSGTATDGWYESTVRLPAGSNGQYGLLVAAYDAAGRTVLPTRQLQAAGFPSTVTATTTKAPGAPTGLTVQKTIAIPWRLAIRVEWKPPLDTSVAVADYVLTANSACGDLPPVQPSPTGGVLTFIYYDWPLIGTCQVSVQAVNGYGKSPAVIAHS
jgi:hypothetical protein